MRKTLALALLLPTVLFTGGCGGGTEPAVIEKYPPVTPEEQKVIDENIEALKDQKNEQL